MNTENSFELLFLGTCACDFSPRLKTDLKNKFDKDARRSSALLIDGHMLIDCGYHTVESLGIAGIPLSDITDIIITHLHEDHYLRENVQAIADAKSEPLRLWVRDGAENSGYANVDVHYMTQFEAYDICGARVTGIPANHSPKHHPQHFVIERGEKSFFYGCDGAWFLHDSFKFLKNKRLSLAVFDCTCGDYVGDFRAGEHNSIPMIRLMLPSLKTIGAIDENTKIMISHLAPSLHKPHDETEKIIADFGTVAYDGLALTL
ncbi:MAG: MBL fold metallo-hydrolase [Clostridia bacterium]|nr:MBL fold metallo-hydrolase [Clostridia bacterium]